MSMGSKDDELKLEIYDHFDVFDFLFCIFYFHFVMHSSLEESVIQMSVTRGMALEFGWN